ncbi:unnamed protein product [Gongylonema pulchrum]|uniref:AB hydrolase-1 domain-containing protein n=1 Tax=Gongylonema pulchrum TaxID=637853 RepID=A0A183EMR9_9BILA|nr:unnamed protein product [Gongylonema pulchrum]
MDELLTIVSIYWFNGNIANSLRYYKEHFRNPFKLFSLNRYISVPTGYAAFPKDLMRQPKEVIEMMFNLTSYTEMESGAHFVALEVPKLLADDLIKFVKTIPELITEVKGM